MKKAFIVSIQKLELTELTSSIFEIKKPLKAKNALKSTEPLDSLLIDDAEKEFDSDENYWY